MYSGQHRTSKNSSDSSSNPAPSQFAPPRFVVQPQAKTDLSPAQNTTLEPLEKAEEVGNETVEVQRLSESGANGDEDANSGNGGTIQRAFSGYDGEKLPFQTKLTIGAPGDKYEQEADSMAEKVMSIDTLTATNSPTIQSDSEAPFDSTQEQPLVQSIHPLIQRQVELNIPRQPITSISPLIQRQIDSNKNRTQSSPIIYTNPFIQRFIQRAGGDIPSQENTSLESRLASQKGSGSPLDEQTRSFMEPRFGNDFSSVRVHTDSTAIQMNKELGAQAFTHGNDIFYSAGKSPGQNSLTAHELTHTIQQTGRVQPRRQPEKDNKQPRLSQKYPHTTGTVIQNKLTTGIQPRIQRKTDPGQVLEQLKNTPPSQAATAYDTAQANSATAWSEQKQTLEESLPQIPAPTGLPAKNSGVKQTPQTANKADTNKEPLLPGGEKAPVTPNPLTHSDTPHKQEAVKLSRILDPNSQECQALLQKIRNIIRDIQKRIGELEENMGKLPETHFNDDKQPRLSKRGHRRLINEMKATLAQNKAIYVSKCGQLPDDVKESADPNNNWFQLPDMQWSNPLKWIPPIPRLNPFPSHGY